MSVAPWINTIAELKAALRHGPYAWPGGYPLYFLAADGEALSFAAVKAELRQVLYSIRHQLNDGWRVVGVEVNWEDPDLTCAHTGQPIQSAYGETDA